MSDRLQTSGLSPAPVMARSLDGLRDGAAASGETAALFARLTRRDRHAMQLALDVVRADRHGDGAVDATAVLVEGDDVCRAIRLAILTHNDDGASRYRHPGAWHEHDRWVRVRLALLLRTLLRADDSDYGTPLCTCGKPWVPSHDPHFGRCYAPADGCQTRFGDEEHGWWLSSYAPVRPLWEASK